MPSVDFSTFEATAGLSFKDKELLKQAFTHRSYLNENREGGLSHNERLEFLGDAVLELAVTEHLYAKYPDQTEGDLTAFRAALVNAVTLSGVARDIGVNDYLRLSKGEAKDTGRAREIILANAMEAIIGAIYLDQGYDAAKGFIARTLFGLIDKIVEDKAWIDAKSLFQERVQSEESVTPAYKTMREEGPDHSKRFTVGVYIGNTQIAEGRGPSKQEAEQDAARKALERKGWM